MSNGYADRTHCKNGHEYTIENTRHRKDGGRVCKRCKAESRLRQVERAKLLREGDVLARYDEKKTAVQRVLAPKAEAMPTWERMWEYMDEARTPCHTRPQDFIDYDDPCYPEEDTGRPIPSAVEARRMCAPCPLLELCGTFAAKNKEGYGIWGGKRYLDGKVYNG